MMNPEKFTSFSADQLEAHKPDVELSPSIELISEQKVVEQLELSQGELYRELKNVVTTIPEGTSQRTEAEGILRQFSELIGRKTRVLVTVLSLLSPLTAFAQDADTVEENVNITETHPGYSEAATESLETLYEKVWNDNHETEFVLYGKPGEEREVIALEGESESNEVRFSGQDQMDMDEKIFAIQQNDAENIAKHRLIIQHNHPAPLVGAHYNLSDDTLEQMESGETSSLVVPPSMTDLFSYEQMGFGMDIIGQVQEPSGTWTFKHDRSHPVSKIVKESRSFDAFTSHNSNPNVHEIDTRVTHIVAAAMNKVESEVQTQFGFSYSDTVVDLLNTVESIRNLSAQGEDVSGYISLYIELGSRIGVSIEYTPHTSQP